MTPASMSQETQSREITSRAIVKIMRQGQQIVQYRVELAQNSQEMKKGLMYRKFLAEDEGMLFVFSSPHTASFWMKNTYIPLDMIFITEAGVIESFVTRRDVQSYRSSRSKGAVGYVLELNAGQVQKNNIKRGDKLIWHKENN